MAGVNTVILVGRLGEDPNFRKNDQGQMARFPLATESGYKDSSGEQKSITEWHKIVVFGPRAEACNKYLQKGSQVFIDGKLKTRSYEENGEKKYITEIIVNEIQFLDSKAKNEIPA